MRDASGTPKKLPNAGETWATFRIPAGRVISLLIFGLGAAAAAVSELGAVFSFDSDFGFPVAFDLAAAAAGTEAEDFDGAKRALQPLKTLMPLLNPDDIVALVGCFGRFRRREASARRIIEERNSPKRKRAIRSKVQNAAFGQPLVYLPYVEIFFFSILCQSFYFFL